MKKKEFIPSLGKGWHGTLVLTKIVMQENLSHRQSFEQNTWMLSFYEDRDGLNYTWTSENRQIALLAGEKPKRNNSERSVAKRSGVILCQ